jgi:hyperosmotically inducible protein
MHPYDSKTVFLAVLRRTLARGLPLQIRIVSGSHWRADDNGDGDLCGEGTDAQWAREGENMKTGTGLKTTGSAVAVLAFVMLTVGVCSAGAAAPRSQRDDVRSLSKQVHRELMTLPWYGVFDDLEYRINGSEVMLTGQVVRPITKSDAEASVKKLEGVTRVVNNITVLPLSEFDDQIRRAEFRAIFSDASLGRYAMGAVPSIHIIVDNGHVLLDGVVSNKMDYDIANIRASSVPGVFSVTNNLRIG